MRFDTLDEWLSWQACLHWARIDPGLERVGEVWRRLRPAGVTVPVITVGGTNGKGSSVGYLESIFLAGGYRVCAYTSPHLSRYNERIRINGIEADDEAICAAFERIDQVRGDISLSYFEFGTLAALELFCAVQPDVMVLEVGLGGRLDAVNVVDADVALVTRIACDHVDWLGAELGGIAIEKAGIFRAGRPAVIAQADAPPELRRQALRIGALPLQLGREFQRRIEPNAWGWAGPRGASRSGLQPPALRGAFQYDNAAGVLCVIDCLKDRLPLANSDIRRGLQQVRLPGRFTVIPGEVSWLLDVAHNPDAAEALAANLASYPCAGKRHAVLALLADKDAVGVVGPLAQLIDVWHLAPASGQRAMPLSEIRQSVMTSAPTAEVECHSDLDLAICSARAGAAVGDCILVYGSFVAVEAALRNPLVASV